VATVEEQPGTARIARPETPSETTIDAVLRAVNRLRAELGGDALYELPCGTPAMADGGCVLERAFEDLGVLTVDYSFLVGRSFRIEHGLGPFVKRFDRGDYPELIAG
jgi:hypothetical protein